MDEEHQPKTATPAETPKDLVARITDNSTAHRFELSVDGQVSFLNYTRTADTLVLVHTEVPPSLRGRRIGESLVKGALVFARRGALRVVPLCPFVQAFLVKHPHEE